MAMTGLSKMTVAAATALLLFMAIVPAAVAETFTVGAPADQWNTGVDYTAWVTGKTFRVGDTLEFKYGPSHSVNEVNKAGYDSCGGTPINTHSGGDTKIVLNTVGPRYFICPTPGHCEGGMKVAVTVVAASSGTPDAPSPPPSTTPDAPSPPSTTPDAPSPPSTTPGTPATPGSPPAAGTPATPTPRSGSTSPPPPKASGASKGVMSYVLVGASMVLGYGLWM